MQRDPTAFLLDVVDAADATVQAVHGISLQDYLQNRMIPSAVEREFIVIGEALTNLSRVERERFDQIDNASRIISFRIKLTHEYAKVDHVLVWGVIQSYLSPLREVCFKMASARETGTR